MAITLWEYYARVAERIQSAALREISDLDAWERQRSARQREFMHSMGLDPLPAQCELRVRPLGEFSGEGYTAKKLAYQLFDNVWSTGTMYTPDPLPAEPQPGILYVCGHTISGPHGYQRHAAMWAKRGYICFVINTIEQGDNPGDHHELYYGQRLDILSMGFTAAGGELWNSMRALDVLAGTPGVDRHRLGVTGISGGGAHSFFLAAADERIQAVATAAGVVSVAAYNRKRQLNGHCDCMWPYNPYQRDASEFAALIAPRPLLFCFAREDALFSAENYRTVFEQTHRIYRLYGADANCELFEYPGPHQYQPETLDRIDDWFDTHLAGEARAHVEQADIVEEDERTTTWWNGAPPRPDHLNLLPELLTRRPSVALPAGPQDWPRVRETLLGELRGRVLHWLKREPETLNVQEVGDWLVGQRLRAYTGEIGGMEVLIHAMFDEEPSDRLLLAVAGASERLETVRNRVQARYPGGSLVVAELRGTGPNEPGESYRIPLLRAGVSVGLTQTMLWIRDILEILRLCRTWPEAAGAKVSLYGHGDAGVACLYAAALDPKVAGVVADEIPLSHLSGAWIPGVLEVADIEQVIGLLAPRPVGIVPAGQRKTYWLTRLYERLGVPERLVQGPSLTRVMEGVMRW